MPGEPERAARTRQQTGPLIPGPTNLGIYITEIEAEHGRPHEGLRTAELLVSDEGLAAIPVPERRFHHRMLTAWLHEQLDQDDGVILSLQRSQQETAQEFRYNPSPNSLSAGSSTMPAPGTNAT